jgi:choline monooxygenase
MLYVDNYLEGFHIPFVHNELNSVLDYSSYETQLFDNGVLQIGFAKEGESKFDLPKNHVDYGKSIAAYYWWLFPNLMLNFYPWGLSINLVNPNGYSKTIVKYHGLVADQTKVGLGAGGDVDLVELQDQEIVEACFRGMKSSLYDRGRYSPKMEMGVHHFHRILTN